ncbi:MAG: CbtA family protein [Actinomycetota bacterium]|nr:CbtA family protein [Actinomycetota bacterium]
MQAPRSSGRVGAAVLAGLAAAAVAVAFNLLVAEPVVDEAVRLETSADHEDAATEPFTRAQQRAGMAIGQVLVGVSAGLVFAGVTALAAPDAQGRTTPRRWLGLVAAAAWAAMVLPAVKYPPLPPGAASSLPVGQRQVAYLALVAAGLGGAWAAARLWRATAGRSTGRRLTLSGTALLVPAALAVLLLPTNVTTGDLPAELVGRFRVASLGGQTLFWASFALMGGWLLRHGRPRPVSP